MQTIAYVDGYNLYYGLLRNTSHKWLDIVRLITHICYVQNPQARIVAVKYFTAPVKPSVSTRGDIAQHSQDKYHRALQKVYPNQIEIIKGYYTLEKGSLPVYKKTVDKNNRVDVWRLEEKQTDVNIALSIYRDVVKCSCEQVF